MIGVEDVVTLVSPNGITVTVGAEQADVWTAHGYAPPPAEDEKKTAEDEKTEKK
nr:MAG TPA: hypothetical protein [Caudoviricetes sp.]